MILRRSSLPPQPTARTWTAALVGAALIALACTAAPAGPTASPAARQPVAGSPAASPTTPAPPAAGQTVFITNTDGQGADFRQTPGPSGARIRVVPDGAVFVATGQEQQIDGQTWRGVRDSTGLTGWALAQFLSTTPPPLPTPTAMLAAPTATSFRIPTFTGATPTPAGPRPTDTLVPVGPGRQPPPAAPLPPAPTARPATPTPLRPAPAIPTLIDPDEGGLIQCQDGTVSAGGVGSTCSGHGGIAP